MYCDDIRLFSHNSLQLTNQIPTTTAVKPGGMYSDHYGLKGYIKSFVGGLKC
jgi:hypothetical protein